MGRCPSPQQISKQSGFTLIEVAIALVIVTVFLSGSLVTYTHFSNKYKIEATQAKMDKVMDALSVYAQKNYRLPCPADPAASASTATRPKIGTETRSDNAAKQGKCFNTSTNNSYIEATGLVPWRDLGLREEDVIDAWGRYLTYKPAPFLTVDMTDQDQLDTAPPGNVSNSEIALSDSLKYNSTLNDVNNACRSTLWYDKDGKHVDRAKAMFCCNAPPSPAYLADPVNGSVAAKAVDITDWNQSTTMVAQEVGQLTNNSANTATPNAAVTNLAGLPVTSVGLTNQWLQGPDTPGAYGDFSDPYGSVVGQKTPSALNAVGAVAVSLVSHGPNGKLAFLYGQSKLNRQLGRFDAAGSYQRSASYSSSRPAELEILDTLQISAGMIFNPKTAKGLINRTGLKENSSDDLTTYLRTDQLISKVGGNNCIRTANIQPAAAPVPKPAVPPDVASPGPGNCFKAVPKRFSFGQSGTYCQTAAESIARDCGILTATKRTTNPPRYSELDILKFGIISDSPTDPVKARCVRGVYAATPTSDGCTTLWTAGVKTGCYVCGYEFEVTGDCTEAGQCANNAKPGNTTQNQNAPVGAALCKIGDPIQLDGAAISLLNGVPNLNPTTKRWEWKCKGSADLGAAGVSATCSIKKVESTVATCGPYATLANQYNDTDIPDTQPSNLCGGGSQVSNFIYFEDTTNPYNIPRSYSWVCTGEGGTASVTEKNCKRVKHPKVTGQCNPNSKGKRLFSTPAPSGGNGPPCTYGTLSPGVTGDGSPGNPWTWGCIGSYGGGPDTPCTATIKAHAINGECGNANGISTISPPSNNLCKKGNPSNVNLVLNEYKWNCNGIDDDTTDSEVPTNESCTAPKLPEPINGQCGSLDNNNGLSARPADTDPGLCAANGGTPTPVTPTDNLGPWTWQCMGNSTGSPSQTCHASRAPTHGACKPYGATYSAQPATNTASACTEGAYTDSNDDLNTYKWSCTGTDTVIVPCSAARATPSKCKFYTATYTTQPATDAASGCTSGIYADINDDGINFKWTCASEICTATKQ